MSCISVTIRFVDYTPPKTKTGLTLDEARAFAQKHVGKHPEIGTDYAVSADGVATARVTGAFLSEIFPAS